MQAFKRGAVILLGLAAAWMSTQAATAQHQHGTQPAAKVELGTSAAVDREGKLWIVGKEASGQAQYVFVQTSSDGGKTWSAARRVQQHPEPVSAEGENRPKIAFGGGNDIYITYTKPLDKPYTGEIRMVRSVDGGKTYLPPVTVHANRDVITHRFESLIVDKEGRVYVAWIDKRDMHAALARKQRYAGAALYYAVSEDGGASFKGDYKIADHSCECCRIALALNPQGRPVALWRHVFEPNARDHALMELTPDGKLSTLSRASFDDWRVDACPHHGPGLAFSADGTRHQTWFNVSQGEGGVFYASTDATGKLGKPQRIGSAQAAHADVAVHGDNVVVVWKQFDGKATAILGKMSSDGGKAWAETTLAQTTGASDQPRLVASGAGIVLVWRTQNEGVQTVTVDRRQAWR
ncbi:sialidase family protein [Noviherbaspirillum saxi]|uniref:Exo-alpha-sialidase n=1 Tax=Noviherbaspirillum saxi TaxID=2320863 RepID=A0A3A3FQ87_9BURK|nr:sialidase family protein [Noviherbaspirillum saxi]RJF98033.1 exo-alpha-sialidase [Noviherbaspirillum saxi]